MSERYHYHCGRSTRLQTYSKLRYVSQLQREHNDVPVQKPMFRLTVPRCIGQTIWIRNLQSGIHRIPNDAFDIRFGREIKSTSPAIWDDFRQDFIHNANPVRVHSHNDYLRRIPLFEALASGCISVEADVHLIRGDLLVGHSARSLHKEETLRNMYLEPLHRMLVTQNAHMPALESPRGIFTQDPSRSVVLLVDHKTNGPEAFAELHRQLQPLRDLDYLTYWNGTNKVTRPLTIVTTGNVPFDSVIALSEDHRDIFFDAPLEVLPSILDDWTIDPPIFKYNQSNSHYASTQYHNALFRPRRYDYYEDVELLKGSQWDDISASQLQQAASRGLLSRYWGTPEEPPNLREIVWRSLVDEKVDLINMDDMGAVRDRARGWGHA